ncbi:MAG: glycosyltransferase family 4 protein [Endomicrobium sp.]|jgi:glycosyltransferase involved in cell wall biosynthesis|nr:glycosyltransferase family 4 protein [Endomicrobium sp.]
MKIAFIGGRDIHQIGGIENYMFNLCGKLVEMGHEPIVYCESNINKKEMLNGISVIYWKSPKSYYLCKTYLSIKSTLNALFFQKKVQYFHYNAVGPGWACWIPQLFGRKVLLMGHGLEWKRPRYTYIQKIMIKFLYYISIHIIKNFVMVSQEQTDYFLSVYKKKCITIPTAVNLPKIKNIRTPIIDKYGLENNSFFLYLGRLIQDKNPDYLIKAFIKAKLNNKKLVIAGSNDLMPKYVEYLHKLAEGYPDIIFTGNVYGEDKEALLSNCLGFCIVSTLEGLSISLLEAMSYGKPIIASDIEANKEGLKENGIYVKCEDVDDLCDKLQYFCNNVESLSISSAKNIERIKQYFTWDIVAKKYIDYLYSIRK